MIFSGPLYAVNDRPFVTDPWQPLNPNEKRKRSRRDRIRPRKRPTGVWLVVFCMNPTRKALSFRTKMSNCLVVVYVLMMLLYWCFSSYTELQIVNCLFFIFLIFHIKLSLFLSMNYLICCFVLYWDRIGFSIYFKRKWENTWIFFSFFIVDGSLWNSHLFDLTSFIHWIVLLDL